MPPVLQSVKPQLPGRFANSYGIGQHLSAHPTDDRFLEHQQVDSTINLLMNTPSTTRPGSVAAGMAVQFLGQRGDSGGPAWWRQGSAGLTEEDVELGFYLLR